MSVQGTIKRIDANKPVSAKAWYEFCKVKGYTFSANDNMNIASLQTMKDYIQETKTQRAFLLYAEKLYHDINLACNADCVRDYIRFVIGDVDYPKVDKYENIKDYVGNIRSYLGVAQNLDYAIDNRHALALKHQISSVMYNYLGLLELKHHQLRLLRKNPFDARIQQIDNILNDSAFDV